MSFDAFMWLDISTSPTKGDWPVDGEAQDPDFANWMEISEFSFGIENTLNLGSKSGGAGAGKAEFKEFNVKKQTDKASPCLIMQCCLGGHFSDGKFHLKKSGTSASGTGVVPYLQYDFKLVAVQSIEWSGSSGDDVPEEQVVFKYGAIMVIYFPQLKTGGLGPQAPTASWSSVKNAKDFDV